MAKNNIMLANESNIKLKTINILNFSYPTKSDEKQVSNVSLRDIIKAGYIAITITLHIWDSSGVYDNVCLFSNGKEDFWQNPLCSNFHSGAEGLKLKDNDGYRCIIYAGGLDDKLTCQWSSYNGHRFGVSIHGIKAYGGGC